MYKYPKVVEGLIEEFSLLPGVGPKSANRIVLNLLYKNKSAVVRLKAALDEAGSKVSNCTICGTLVEYTDTKCTVCKDSDREPLLMVVESVPDMFTIEQSGLYRGKYHILGGLVSPLRGVSLEDLWVANLIDRVREDQIQEIVSALPSSIEGDTTSLLIKDMVIKHDAAINFSRLGRGLPSGANVEYLDPDTLRNSLANKSAV